MSSQMAIQTLIDQKTISAALGADSRSPRPDALLLGPRGSSAGLWWNDTPLIDGQPVGTIGLFSAGDGETAQALLHRACDELAARNCRVAIGPMDRDTWHRHRLVTQSSDEPPFSLEPWTPPEWPEWWASAGFRVTAEYVSSLNTTPQQRDPRLPRTTARLAIEGVSVRRFRLNDAQSELDALYDVSTIAFRNNFLYMPISRAEFLALYSPLLPQLDPRLVLLAECKGQPCGFVFAYPSFTTGAQPTVVLKTLAALPGRKFAGLGNLLVDELHQRSLQLGFRRVIHALMHVSNNSLNLSLRHARPMRRYALMAFAL